MAASSVDPLKTETEGTPRTPFSVDSVRLSVCEVPNSLKTRHPKKSATLLCLPHACQTVSSGQTVAIAAGRRDPRGVSRVRRSMASWTKWWTRQKTLRPEAIDPVAREKRDNESEDGNNNNNNHNNNNSNNSNNSNNDDDNDNNNNKNHNNNNTNTIHHHYHQQHHRRRHPATATTATS